MSTQAELELQAFEALLDVNTHRLKAHTGWDCGRRSQMWAALQDVVTAATAGIVALEAVDTILSNKDTATCDAPQNDCHYFPAPDDQCRVPALKHHDYCTMHRFQGANDWYEAHEATDCCKACCEGADHLLDGELIEDVKVA